MMFMILLAAFVAAFLLLSKYKNASNDLLLEERATPPTLGIQIICGDCSGEDGSPVKTFMNRFGTCERCGGQSFVIASTLAPGQLAYVQSSIRSELTNGAPRHLSGQVIPFELPLNMKTGKVA